MKHNSNYDEPFIIENDHKSISIACNSSITSDKKSFIFYQNAFTHLLKYGDDFDFGNPINKRIGNCGEAYIYELLLNSGKFKSVKWNMLSTSGKGELLEYNGKKYNIIPDNSYYDILVETFENYKLFIEVKSTKAKFGNKVPFYISQRQIEMMRNTLSPDKYILAAVFSVDSTPKHFFMILKDILG